MALDFLSSYSQKVVANQILANLESSSGMRIAVLCTVTLTREWFPGLGFFGTGS